MNQQIKNMWVRKGEKYFCSYGIIGIIIIKIMILWAGSCKQGLVVPSVARAEKKP